MLKKALIIIGVVFLVVGILGFFNNPVFSVFPVNLVHNLVHIVSGILALIFGLQNENKARQFVLAFGLIYGLVAILGFIAPDFMNSLLAVDTADNWLHTALAAIFLLLGAKNPNKYWVDQYFYLLTIAMLFLNRR